MIIISIKWLGWLRRGFLFQCCAAGGLAVIHKKNEPNLARGIRQESNFFFRILLCFGNCPGTNCLNMTISASFSSKYGSFVSSFPKKSFVPFTLYYILFFAMVRNPPHPPPISSPARPKKTLVEILGTIYTYFQ